MPGIYVHLGSPNLDFSYKSTSYSSAVSSGGFNIHSVQHIRTHLIDTMERIYTMNHVLHGENNTTPMKSQKRNFFQIFWNRYMGGNLLRRPTIFSSKIYNPLSITLVNDELLMPEFVEKSCIQEERSMEYMSKVIFETMQPPTTIDPFIKDNQKVLPDFERYFSDDFNKKEQQIAKQENIDPIIKNLISNMIDLDITCEDKSTMESHTVTNTCKTENLNNIINNSCTTEVNLKKCLEIGEEDAFDTNKNPTSNEVDENAKSFLIVSHSDLPEELYVKPVKKTPISARLSVMCRNAWNSLTTRFYCRTNSMKSEKSNKLPASSYLSKRQCRRRTNIVAMGRSRSRKRCQLRHSGVSQTRHRKERTKRDLAMVIEMDYDICRYAKIEYYGINDHLLNDESNHLDDIDGCDVPDGTLLVKRSSPITFNSSDVTLTKGKPQMIENPETAKHPTEVRYVIDHSIQNNDCNKEASDTKENPSQSRFNLSQSSISSVDSEDSFIVFETSDDKLSKHSTKINDTLESSLQINEDCNNKIYNRHDNPIRSRLLSECSVDSEDSFIMFKDVEIESPKKQETMKYPTNIRYVVDSLTKVNSSYQMDCNSEMFNIQKSTLRQRLLSESSSADSEESFIVFMDSDDESPKQETSKGLTKIHDISDSSINSDRCKNYDKKYMHDDLLQFSENSEDSEDSFCIVFNMELEKDKIDNCNYSKTSTPIQTDSIEDESTSENDEDSDQLMAQTKKVSFAPTSTIHNMVTWNYAYRAARKGPWEEMARDNERFKGRINSIAAVLNPILTHKHRCKVWQERFAFQE